MRDEFTKPTIADIAKGVGYRCSNPACKKATVAANAKQDGVITIGVAAHICAASPGGPRYNPAQTPAERRAKENGIWLCGNCGRMVDVDVTTFPVEKLQEWKRDAQEQAFRELIGPSALPTEEETRIASLVAEDNAASSDSAIEIVFQKAHRAASADLSAYTRTPFWARIQVELTLTLSGEPDAPPFTISKLPTALDVAQEITLVAPPGTGKTTTVLQLARHVLAANFVIPLYFRLGEVTPGDGGFLASLQRRAAFRGVTYDEMIALAERGRLLLVLDGWNELDAASRTNVRLEVDRLRRDWPRIRVVTTTRRQVLDVPVSGPRIDIQLLSEDQQLAIAKAQSGEAGAEIVDKAWRTDGVRQLIATPLYLSALLAGASKGATPTTKEEILRLFVEQHEHQSQHAEALNAVLLGRHKNVLRALAVEMNNAASTALSDADARSVASVALNELRQQGQMSSPPEPLAALQVLTDHHTLTPSGVGTGTISFQHQQFQEWFASYAVEDLMQASAKGDTGATIQLRGTVLDRPAWEESVLFAVERVSRQQGGPATVAHAIRLALAIDPMLAAEMIYRSDPEVWRIIGLDIQGFIQRWHKPGQVDRAVRFMIMTGRPEFEPLIWPLASNENSQVQLPTLRIAPRFRPSVLGDGLPAKIAALPKKTRKSLLALIASESGVDGLDLATEIAKADPSPKVQAEVVQYLQFRRADRHVAQLMKHAHDETWTLVARRRYAEDIHEPEISARLDQVRKTLLDKAATPVERIQLLMEQSGQEEQRDTNIADAIADPAFPIDNQESGAILHQVYRVSPMALLNGLRRRIKAGREFPFYAADFFEQLDVSDDGPVRDAVLDTSRDRHRDDELAALAGIQTVTALIDKYLQCHAALMADRSSKKLQDESLRLQSRLRNTRPSVLLQAIVARGNDSDPVTIGLLSSVISAHGEHSQQSGLVPVDDALRASLASILRHWVNTVCGSERATRGQLANVAGAIGRLGMRELLPDLLRLLDDELARLSKARQLAQESRRRGDHAAASEASHRYDNLYQGAFVRVGGKEAADALGQYIEHPDFGSDAALALKDLSDKELNAPTPSAFRRWPWFDELYAARDARVNRATQKPANEYATPIFEAIDRLARPENDDGKQRLAINLTRIGLTMPHGDHDDLIKRVVALPQSLAMKRDMLAAMTLAGHVLDENSVMQAVDEWLTDAEKDAWQKRQNTWEIEPWLELLPHTSRPESVIDGLVKVKAFYTDGWRQRWERVLTSVAAIPGPAGEALLARLAREHKDIASEFDWMNALLGRGTESAALLFVDLIADGTFGRGPHHVNGWAVARALGPYVAKSSALRAGLHERYEAAPARGRAREVIEAVFAEIGDQGDLIAMIRKYAANGQGFDNTMGRAVYAVTVDEVPISEGSNSYNVRPASVAALRKALFAMLGDTKESELAARCLESIDDLRDEHGIAASDPRHPDVGSAKPWPREAKAPN